MREQRGVLEAIKQTSVCVGGRKQSRQSEEIRGTCRREQLPKARFGLRSSDDDAARDA